MLNVNFEAMNLRTEIENIVHEILMEGVTKEDAVKELLNLHSVSNSIATEYAEFCVRCDRDKLPLLCLEDYIKQYCS